MTSERESGLVLMNIHCSRHIDIGATIDIFARNHPRRFLRSDISSFLSRDILLRIYKQTVLPLLDYGCVIWGECSKEIAQYLERQQNRAMRIIQEAYLHNAVDILTTACADAYRCR